MRLYSLCVCEPVYACLDVCVAVSGCLTECERRAGDKMTVEHRLTE